MNCQNRKTNLANCSCSYEPCSRKGICCECVLYHRKNGQIPGCFFSAAGEKTYDRSVSNFIKDRRCKTGSLRGSGKTYPEPRPRR